MGVAAVRAALLLMSALAFFHAMPASGGPVRQAHGRELVAEYELPAEQVALLRARAEVGSSKSAANTSWDDASQWIGPMQSVGAGRNPYTLVLTLGGTAPSAGDVRTHWQAGWEVQETPTATRDLLLPLAALSSGSVKAGAPLTITAVGTPVSFRGERKVAPMLSAVTAQNFDIQSARLAVWSGPAPWAWAQAMSASRVALLVMGLLCAAAWFALRETSVPSARTPAAEPTAAPRSTLPPIAPAAVAAAPAPSLPPASAPPSRANQAARVVAALRDVLNAGLVVPTEFDHARRRKRSRGLHTG